MIKGSQLTFSGTGATSVLYVDSNFTKQVRTIDFERREYSSAYLLNLGEEDGTEPVLVKNMVGGIIQFNFNCGSASSARDVYPDDDNIDDIFKSMTIRSYSIKGLPCSPTAVEALYNISVDHARRIRSFDSYQKLFSQKISWQFAQELRNDAFAYLTTTGLSVTGAAMTESNVLIRSMSVGTISENTRTQQVVAKDWSVTLDIVTLENQRSYSS